ncbi:hypothetical protein [Pyxidicoccus fallax]|nr:hypothetical protein [Pyxidicoccus fallax]
MRGWGEELIEQGRQQGLAQGVSRGRAEDILRILAKRRVYVHEEARQRILNCTDVDTLDLWFDRSLSATSLSAVFDDLSQ